MKGKIDGALQAEPGQWLGKRRPDALERSAFREQRIENIWAHDYVRSRACLLRRKSPFSCSCGPRSDQRSTQEPKARPKRPAALGSCLRRSTAMVGSSSESAGWRFKCACRPIAIARAARKGAEDDRG